jgi:transcriptional regulator with XRE-family HTH domain
MNNAKKEELLVQLGNHIRTTRKSKKMTLEQLACDANVEISQIYRIEKGKINPTFTTLHAISLGLEIPIRELFQSY